MLNWIRNKFGPVMIGIIIGFIAFVFIFFGVYNPSKTRGLHEGAVAGTVNGDSIPLSDFNRAFTQRVEFYRQISGGKLTDAQIQGARIKESVFQDLVQAKLLSQAAEKAQFGGSDEAVREKIVGMDVFKREGRFDPLLYKQMLAANKYTPTGFEKLIREEAIQGEWREFFKNRMKVSESELTDEFNLSENKRSLKYVMITQEAAAREVSVPKAEIEAYLKDTTQAGLVKAQFDVRKDRELKGRTFESAKEELAAQNIVLKKPDLLKKGADALAAKIASKLKPGKSDADLTAFLKPYGLEVKTTGLVAESEGSIPGLGNVPGLKQAAFAKPSTIDLAAGKSAGKYDNGAWTIVAGVVESKTPDLKSFDKQRTALVNQIQSRKEQALYQAWMKELKEKADIEPNPAVVTSSDS